LQRYRVSQKHGNSVTNWISSLLWISIVIPNFKSHNIVMTARVYFKKGKILYRCVYNVSARWTVKTEKFPLFIYCNFLVLLSTTVCSQNINKQNVNIADETLTDYSFLSRYSLYLWIEAKISITVRIYRVIHKRDDCTEFILSFSLNGLFCAIVNLFLSLPNQYICC